MLKKRAEHEAVASRKRLADLETRSERLPKSIEEGGSCSIARRLTAIDEERTVLEAEIAKLRAQSGVEAGELPSVDELVERAEALQEFLEANPVAARERLRQVFGEGSAACLSQTARWWARRRSTQSRCFSHDRGRTPERTMAAPRNGDCQSCDSSGDQI